VDFSDFFAAFHQDTPDLRAILAMEAVVTALPWKAVIDRRHWSGSAEEL
jgi:hypothetical protein